MDGLAPKVLFIPLDDRPCCLDMMERIASLAGTQLLMPPRPTLGHFRSPGQPSAILSWLDKQEPSLPLVASIDMISWGGLIASRHPDSDSELAQRHFETFCGLLSKRTGPKLVFKTLLRTAPTQTTPEEVDQAEQIVALSRLAFLQQKNRLSPQSHSLETAIEQLKAGISPHVLERYLRVRERNHQFDSLVVSRADQFDSLLVAMDDCQTEGWNLLEKEKLEKLAQTQGQPVVFYPGTDESAALLLCRLLAPERGIEPIWGHSHLSLTQTRYEDRPLGALLQAQIQAGQLRTGQSKRKLFLYGRLGAQKEAAQQATTSVSEDQSLQEFLQCLEVSLSQGDSCVVADLAFANGGDLSLVEALLERGLASKLTGYSAWNTAGNTLGTALANLALYPDHPTSEEDHARKLLLWERLIDDAFYQSRFRFRLKRELGPGLCLADDELQKAHQILAAEFHQFAVELWSQLFPGETPLQFEVTLPWGRFFEVAISPLSDPHCQVA